MRGADGWYSRHMALRKLKVPKHHKAATKTIPRPDAPATAGIATTNLPMQAEQLLHSPKNVRLFENTLNQINAFYDAAFAGGKEVLPIFVGVTAAGLMIELSAIRDRSQSGQPVRAADLTVFTYKLGTDLPHDIQPREIAEVNMVKGQEQIRLHSEEFPMPDVHDGKELARWRFTEAETIQLQTMGIYEIQPENYNEISYGHGIKALGGSEEPILALQHFATELI